MKNRASVGAVIVVPIFWLARRSAAMDFVFSGSLGEALGKLSAATGFPLPPDVEWTRRSALALA